MPSVTDWISSIGSLVGALTGVGALIVAVLSYRRSTRALVADAQTRGAVGATVEAVDALGRAGQFDAMLDDALRRRSGAKGHELIAEDGHLDSQERPAGREAKDDYEAALQKAKRELGLA